MTDPRPTDAAIRLGAALRRLNAIALDPRLADDERLTIAAQLEGLAERQDPPASRYTLAEHDTFREGTGSRVDPRGSHPFYGGASGIATPMEVEVGPEQVEIRTRFDVRHEGAPGWVHGGVIASGFDIVLGRTALEFGHRGPTGTMTVRYLEPTPLDEDLTFAAWLSHREGRKTFVAGELRRDEDGLRCAEAEAIFLTPRNDSDGGIDP